MLQFACDRRLCLKLAIVPRDRPRQPEIVWGLFTLLLIGTGVVKAYFPALADRVMPSCFMKETLGVRCPTCGTGTSLMLLAEGKILEAFQTSWIAPLMLTALVLFDLYLLGTFVARRKIEVTMTRRDSILAAFVGLGALLVSWFHQLVLRP
jgi:hypothetical protein